MNRILVAETDNLTAELERDYLEANGFEVKVLSDGKTVTDEIKTGQYAAVLLDVMLPNKNGFDICREVRMVSNIPVLLMS